MTILLNAIYRFNGVPIKISVTFSTELEENISQFEWKHKRPPNSQTIRRKKNGAGGINLLISGYITKLQSSRQYGTGTKTDI